MRYAIFSDTHSNAPALSHMIQEAQTRQIDAYLCLGDVGNDACVRLVRNLGTSTVFGNGEVGSWHYLSEHNQAWALALPPLIRFSEAGFWISHASPAWPNDMSSLQIYLKQRHQAGGYAFPYYFHEDEQLMTAFSTLLSHQVPLLFHGHTHQQQVWAFDANNQVHRQVPRSFSLQPSWAYVVGVGSVGQPRDVDKPSYVIFDTETVTTTFVRV